MAVKRSLSSDCFEEDQDSRKRSRRQQVGEDDDDRKYSEEKQARDENAIRLNLDEFAEATDKLREFNQFMSIFLAEIDNMPAIKIVRSTPRFEVCLVANRKQNIRLEIACKAVPGEVPHLSSRAELRWVRNRFAWKEHDLSPLEFISLSKELQSAFLPSPPLLPPEGIASST